MNSFDASMAYAAANEQLVIDLLYKLIPQIKGFQQPLTVGPLMTDITYQKLGIDRLVRWGNGHIFLVDDKVRKTAYDDIYLEEYSDQKHLIPGWLDKPSWAHAISYIRVPKRDGWIFSYPDLVRAWKENKTRWLSEYRLPSAENFGWVTTGCGVPPIVLREAGVRAVYASMPAQEIVDEGLVPGVHEV